jgi:hypothetical protein
MPKTKIGDKIIAEANGNSKEGRRDFTDGHKSFDSFACRLLIESQARERKAAEAFEKNKETLIKPRNPLTGEPTPRIIYNNITGEFIQKVGEPLFAKPVPFQTTSSRVQTARSNSSSNNNNNNNGSYSSRSHSSNNYSNNPLKRTNKDAERIASLQNLQDTVNAELAFLQKQMEEKEAKLKMLQGKR